MAFKVLGINWGSPKGTNRKCLEWAMLGAEEAGCETEIIDTFRLNIGRCMGCGICSSSSRNDGAPTVECVVKDDFQMLRDKFLDADAIITGAPVYALTPTGQYKNFLDRLGPATDFGQTTKEAMKRRSLVPDPKDPTQYVRMDESGQIPPLDPRVYTKRRPIAYISAGGAKDHHWVSLTMPMMKFLGFPVGCVLIDEVEVWGGKRADPRRLKQLGRNVGEAAGKHYSTFTYKGDKPGVCPVCHCDFITLNAGRGTKVECPVCGIEGELKIVDDRIEVDFPISEWDNSRLMFNGLLEHCNYGTLVNPPRMQPPKKD